MERFEKIVLNIPHASLQNYHKGWSGSATFFNDIKDLTDWHTDIIFETDKATVFIFPYSRFYVDVERLPDDPLEKDGQGILYTKYKGHTRMFDKGEKAYLTSLYTNYRSEIARELDEHTILIDCHSFSDDTAHDIDVCIGYNDDESKPDDETIGMIVGEFAEKGYTAGINVPYSNSITPKERLNYKSVMIELNKRIYMDETTLLLNHDNYKKVMYCLDKIYDKLLGILVA